jgi:DNA polymerase IIIc chi subunit
MLFDKGRPITKYICELCKKEIEPGKKMIISTVSPSHERQLFSRFYEPSFYAYIDNAPKYHEKCYYKIINDK